MATGTPEVEDENVRYKTAFEIFKEDIKANIGNESEMLLRHPLSDELSVSEWDQVMYMGVHIVDVLDKRNELHVFRKFYQTALKVKMSKVADFLQLKPVDGVQDAQRMAVTDEILKRIIRIVAIDSVHDYFNLTLMVLDTFVQLGTITDEDREVIQKKLENLGQINAKNELLRFIIKRKVDWYLDFLFVAHKEKSDYLTMVEPNLAERLEDAEGDAAKRMISSYYEDFISSNRAQCGEMPPQTVLSPNMPAARREENTQKPSSLHSVTQDLSQLSLEPRPSAPLPKAAPVCSPPVERTKPVVNCVSQPQLVESDSAGAACSPQDAIDWDTVDLDDLLESAVSVDVPDGRGDGDAVPELKLYPYQDELAQPALNGENVIVCAPTGSGKTHVALKIALEHLRRPSERPKAKVAFLVHRVNLVDQQSAVFKRYFKGKYEVIGLSGADNDTPLAYRLEKKDVFVMTADILHNNLRSPDPASRLESIKKFSLIIFDECHNCDKGHPYNRIMEYYFEAREEARDGLPLPQIVGLTASPGTNKANKVTDALNHLKKLCANLDARIIKRVTESIWDLTERQKEPKDIIKQPPGRQPDYVGNSIQKQMKSAEGLLAVLHQRNALPVLENMDQYVNAPDKRGSQQYANFVGRLPQVATQCKVPEVRNGVSAIHRFLDTYNRSLQINNLFRSKDALKFIRDEFDQLASDSNTGKIEDKLKQYWRTELPDMERNLDMPNPALTCLKEIILNMFKAVPDSRIIVFVRQRLYTQILIDFCEDDPDLQHIPVDLIVGANANAIASGGGRTHTWLREVLTKFHNGNKKVLFSTTVAEEGLDVAKCNLVIRYGHVTNETAMVQSKGRARALESQYVVIVPQGEEWLAAKEETNKERLYMMNKAMELFDRIDPTEWDRDFLRLQRDAIQERRINKWSSQQHVLQNVDRVFKLSCAYCGAYACDSTDFRAAQVHRFMVNEEHLSHVIVEPAASVQVTNSLTTGGKIRCKQCKKEWGVVAIYKSAAYPAYAICNFRLCEVNGQGAMSKKKWKDAPFNVPELSFDEVLDRLNRIGNTWAESTS